MVKRLKVLVSLLVIMINIVLIASPTGAIETDEFISGDWKYKFVGDEIMVTRYIGNETDIVIPEVIEGINVTMIGQDAFYYPNEIKTIRISSSITEIVYLWSVRYSPFEKCSFLENIYVDDMNKKFMSLNGVLYTKDKTGLLQYPKGRRDVFFEIPEEATYCGNNAFSGCKYLKYISLGKNLKGIGNRAFSDCTELTTINIPDGMEKIGHYAFTNCKKITNLLIPNSVNEIGESE